MQDTFISLGRGIDGVVGRMVDRIGDGGTGKRSSGETVELLRYAIVSARAAHERVLHVDEILITDGVAGKDLEKRLLAPYATHADRNCLHVHTRVLRRWPRRPVPATARPQRAAPVERAARTALNEIAPPTPPARESTSKAKSPRPKAGRPKIPAPPRRRDTPPAKTPAAPATNSVTSEDLDRRLVDILAEAEAPGLPMSQLVKRTGERSARLRVRLQQLGRDGTVCRAGDGLKTRYRLTET